MEFVIGLGYFSFEMGWSSVECKGAGAVSCERDRVLHVYRRDEFAGPLDYRFPAKTAGEDATAVHRARNTCET
jgi:hypothetical protein